VRLLFAGNVWCLFTQANATKMVYFSCRITLSLESVSSAGWCLRRIKAVITWHVAADTNFVIFVEGNGRPIIGVINRLEMSPKESLHLSDPFHHLLCFSKIPRTLDSNKLFLDKRMLMFLLYVITSQMLERCCVIFKKMFEDTIGNLSNSIHSDHRCNLGSIYYSYFYNFSHNTFHVRFCKKLFQCFQR